MKSSGLALSIQRKYIPYKQSKELVLERNNIIEQDFSTKENYWLSFFKINDLKYYSKSFKEYTCLSKT